MDTETKAVYTTAMEIAAKIDKNLPLASAFLTNDENIVFVGSNKDVLTMKIQFTWKEKLTRFLT